MMKHIDTAILSLPIVGAFGLGVSLKCLESSSNPINSVIGWLGSRACMVLTITSSTPLLIYSCATNVLANALSNGSKVILKKDYPLLNNLAQHTEFRLKLALIAALSMPLLIIAGPTVVQSTKKCINIYINAVAVLQDYQLGKIKFTEAVEVVTKNIRDIFNF